jgi:hypothetical protein
MESIKTPLIRIAAHLKTQTVHPIEIQGPCLASHSKLREWNMPDGLYTFNLIIKVDTEDFRPYFDCLVSLQVQTAIYHLHRLPQVDINNRSGKYNYGLYNHESYGRTYSPPRRVEWVREKGRYSLQLTDFLVCEQERYERASVWDFSNNFARHKLDELEIFLMQTRIFSKHNYDTVMGAFEATES